MFCFFFAGPASDSLRYHGGIKFSTRDVDNDASSDHCAQIQHGAWWFNNCSRSDLNGDYFKAQSNGSKGVFWYNSDPQAGSSHKAAEMKLGRDQI